LYGLVRNLQTNHMAVPAVFVYRLLEIFSNVSIYFPRLGLDFVIIAMAHLSDIFRLCGDHNYGCYRFNFCAFQAISQGVTNIVVLFDAFTYHIVHSEI
jgi:hypothetical protein